MKPACRVLPRPCSKRSAVWRPCRLGTAHLWQAPHNVYPCQGADRWIAITASDDQWRTLCRVMGEPAWAMETRFATIQGRWQHRHDLDAHLGQWTATHDAQALMHLLQAHGVPAGTVHTRATWWRTHTCENGPIWRSLPTPTLRQLARACMPGGLSARCPTLALHLVSALGQHNVEILRDVAALSEAEIQGLVEAGVLAAQPRDTTRPAPGATAYQAGDLRGDPHYRAAVQALVDAAHQPSGNSPAGQGGNRAGIVR